MHIQKVPTLSSQTAYLPSDVADPGKQTRGEFSDCGAGRCSAGEGVVRHHGYRGAAQQGYAVEGALLILSALPVGV